MKSDIEIAQEAELYPIAEIAKMLDITIDDLELYGKYKAKISEEYLKKIEKNKKWKTDFSDSNQSDARRRGENYDKCWSGTSVWQIGKKSGDCAERTFTRSLFWN